MSYRVGRKEKGLELYCYCFMHGHVHFIFLTKKDFYYYFQDKTKTNNTFKPQDTLTIYFLTILNSLFLSIGLEIKPSKPVSLIFSISSGKE